MNLIIDPASMSLSTIPSQVSENHEVYLVQSTALIFSTFGEGGRLQVLSFDRGKVEETCAAIFVTIETACISQQTNVLERLKFCFNSESRNKLQLIHTYKRFFVVFVTDQTVSPAILLFTFAAVTLDRFVSPLSSLQPYRHVLLKARRKT